MLTVIYTGFFASQVVEVIYQFKLLDDCDVDIEYLYALGMDYLVQRLLSITYPIALGGYTIQYIAHRLALSDNNDQADYAL